ncbi:hypothetical protein BT96DRAFT_304335 [Gymnopus androsaceus JB14]|uniref:Uncharacterized protein n=1 Tax=Gymnopus androsaceus JB14 TaxID=1447944 RepID=A0A6A4H189_9AGAR|nr:hypothetical protein BT96DRAFT_304335 [Gymnopus androsaceus JB14]
MWTIQVIYGFQTTVLIVIPAFYSLCMLGGPHGHYDYHHSLASVPPFSFMCGNSFPSLFSNFSHHSACSTSGYTSTAHSFLSRYLNGRTLARRSSYTAPSQTFRARYHSSCPCFRDCNDVITTTDERDRQAFKVFEVAICDERVELVVHDLMRSTHTHQMPEQRHMYAPEDGV